MPSMGATLEVMGNVFNRGAFRRDGNGLQSGGEGRLSVTSDSLDRVGWRKRRDKKCLPVVARCSRDLSLNDGEFYEAGQPSHWPLSRCSSQKDGLRLAMADEKPLGSANEARKKCLQVAIRRLDSSIDPSTSPAGSGRSRYFRCARCVRFSMGGPVLRVFDVGSVVAKSPVMIFQPSDLHTTNDGLLFYLTSLRALSHSEQDLSLCLQSPVQPVAPRAWLCSLVLSLARISATAIDHDELEPW
ncbi:uncharacterized protein J3D65DRAFT_305886 [Phyllosticta citribraziliensis]|uniref:Uncharacterized protein n=1 Tax=Phyllosticta citribraziliensis TaxID=989973 RepID=A0ABR1LXU4_9PEZI